MKNLLFGLLASILFSLSGLAQEIEKSTAIITKENVYVKNAPSGKSARSFLLLNFDNKNKLSQEYYVQGHLFTDDGKKNDLKAGDGIYTAVDFSDSGKNEADYLMKSDSFQYQKELDDLISTNKWSIKFGCKVRHVRSGYSVLGASCAHAVGGCIEFYDCEVSVTFG